MTTPAVIDNVTCLGCGCTCDDITVVEHGGRVVETPNACALGARWFDSGNIALASRAEERARPDVDAITLAAERLTEARHPLVYLAPGLSCESQRAAVAVADLLGAHLDTVTSSTAAPHVLASQESGWASATLGEIRNRADVIVFWGIDLESRYPRFASRYAPEPVGTHVPQGRASRTVVAVDVGDARSTYAADHRVCIEPADELATLVALEALVRERAGGAPMDGLAGAPWDNARALAPHMAAARYLALVYDAEPDDRAPRTTARFAALTSLSQTLNDPTRCAAIALRAGGNRSGADSVLVAQTGFPFAVSFARGHPRYDPHGGSALALLARGEIDVALVAGDASLVPGDVAQSLARVRCVVVGPGATSTALGAERLGIDTGIDGIHVGGTTVRSDDVPLPLHPTSDGLPSTAALIAAIALAVRRRRV